MKTLREEALNQIALKQKQRNEANSSLLNSNKREAVREQMKVDSFIFRKEKRILLLNF
jgi:hypothetical protein